MQTPKEIAESIANKPFAFPGGYRRIAVTDDGGVLCHNCCRDEIGCIEESDPGDGWHVVGEMVHWEGEPMQCGHCGTMITAEYGVSN